MKRIEISKWLKSITILLACMGAAILAVVVPNIAAECKQSYPELSYLYWPAMYYVWTVFAGCYGILIFFWRVCSQIGKGNAFSKENAQYFVWISRIALAIGVILFGGIVYLGWNNWLNPMINILLIIGVVAAITLSILAAALSHLILKAYEMKEENELTI